MLLTPLVGWGGNTPPHPSLPHQRRAFQWGPGVVECVGPTRWLIRPWPRAISSLTSRNCRLTPRLENLGERAQSCKYQTSGRPQQTAESRQQGHVSAEPNRDLVLVCASRQKVKLDNPITVGFSILEISKFIMYQFYYELLKAKYGDRCTLLFTDTDSLCCKIQTNDLHKDMREHLDLYDTSISPPTTLSISGQTTACWGR